MGLSPIHAIEWSDWVIRLPGGGGSTEGTFLLLLGAAALLWAIARGISALADKLWPLLGTAMTLLAALLAILLIGRFADRGEREPVPTITTEVRIDDCNDELLDRCPPLINNTSE